MKRDLISFFWSCIKPYKWNIFIMLMAPVIGAFFIPVSNYAIKLIIDKIVSKPQFEISDVMFPVILFILNSFFLELFWRISNFFEYRSQPYIEVEIIKKAYEKILNYPFRFFQDNLSGSISSKISALQTSYRKIFDHIHHRLLGNSLTILITLIFLANVNAILGSIMGLWCAFFLPIIIFASKRTAILSKDYTSEKQKASGFIVDSIINVSSVLLFASKKREMSLVNRQLDLVRNKDKVRLKYICLLHVFIGVTYFLVSVGVLFLMINLRQKNLVSIGDFAMVFGLLFYLLEVVFHTANEMHELIKESGELEESFSILEKGDDLIKKEPKKKLVAKKGNIEIKNLNFIHGEGKAMFENLNLSIKAGEKIGLVGHSGAGKSTLINLLLKFFETESGEILIDGQNIFKCSSESVRNSIAVIPQDTSLFHRSLLQNISYGKERASNRSIIEGAKKAHIDEFIKELPQKYETLVGERGIKLSGGQRQRISIARAILKDAPILILDEATSSLDSQTERDIQESLNLLISDKNKTVIAIAHRLSTLKNMDRIIVMDKGKIIEEGTHEELIHIQNSHYKKLWELQKLA